MTKKLQDHFTLLNKKNQKINQTLEQIAALNGLSIDVFDSIESYRDLWNNIHQDLHQKWNVIVQNQRQNQSGNDFEEFDSKISELFDNVSDLYREATSQNIVSSRISNLKKNDTTEFKEALKYHKRQSILFLLILGLLAVSAVITICSIFTFKNSELFPENFIQLLQSDSSYRTLIVLILIQLGGKLTVIIGLAWLLKFVGGLHSKHSQQAIIYQDRIAGLSTSELIITSSRTSIRDLVLKQMTETYLSDKENAFKEHKEIQKEETASKKDLVNLLKSAIETFKK